MFSIGGYFSLELSNAHKKEYHNFATKLNSGRYCLEYILRAKKYKKVYLPYYVCDAVLQPILKLKLQYEFYHIDAQFHIAEEIKPEIDGVVLYCNYFGLMNDYVKEVANLYSPNVIIDNTQAFFAHPLAGIDTFYTCRKFFGVADGAYLYTDTKIEEPLLQDYSSERMIYLLNRIDKSAEEAFSEYHINEKKFEDNEIKQMSEITRRIMQSVDYADVANRRIANYHLLDKALSQSNVLQINLGSDEVPMVFPYLCRDNRLRKKLIQNKVYVATFWPNVEEWAGNKSIEHQLACNLLPLPIDQRYGEKEMNIILNLIYDTNER
ncbi:hypothetical protein [Prevotella sp. kh1p2]|uniref:hypothetical protein n=1 Tax=Prevotella sp. kh1p2 TaxID=1761883 RepID=UPI0008CBCA74|nr:hypothetical protein [Prevotella sp. kh1p2]SET11363.1 hypothetical protein SAMN04487825_11483 [Prevotella sp. kh1p2]SNU11812.1 hypothetical protein SAMN06298210_11422 [Prevotellaceae bacterium KH2P17]